MADCCLDRGVAIGEVEGFDCDEGFDCGGDGGLSWEHGGSDGVF